MYLQLQHGGRNGHPATSGHTPVAPSPIALPGTIFTPDGHRPTVTPRELTTDGIATTVADFARAARNAVAAGFAGGPVANRIRFAGNTTNAIEEGDTPSIYRALIGELAGDGLAYLNIAWPEPLVANPTLPWPGPLPADDGRARPGVHRQPDLVGRYRTGAPLNPLRGNDFMDRGGAPGYTDCPALDTVGA